MLINRDHRNWALASAAVTIAGGVSYVAYVSGRPYGPSGGSWPGIAYGVIGTTFMVTAGLLAASLLAGCTGTLSPAPESTDAMTPTSSPTETDAAASGEQTVEEACESIVAGLEELGEVDATTLQDDLANDPEAAMATLDEAQSAILDATDEVENSEIRPYADRAAEATREFFDAARETAEDGANADPAEVQDEFGEFTAALAELQTACTGE